MDRKILSKGGAKMNILKRPDYRLKVENWWEDGTKDEIEFYELTEIDGKLKLTRREFLAVTALLSALLSGCASLSKMSGADSCKDIKAHNSFVLSISFNPDGKLLASGSYDKTIKLWEVPSGKLIKTLEGHEADVKSVSFSPDGKLLASGSYDKTIKLWEVPSGKLLSVFFDPKVTEEDCKGVTFKYINEYGQVVTYTLPCGSPIPPGATCICNCIPGSLPRPTPSPGGTYQYCTCVPVCVCIPVV